MSKIYLIGFSYTGKSAVGRVLARELGWKFFDTDTSITRRVGREISDIFSEDGESSFRQLESEVLREIAKSDGIVVATGGGVVVNPENLSLMAESGIVMCLEAKPDTLVRRMQDAQQRNASRKVRPLLGGDNPLEKITALKGERQLAYAAADWTVHTDGLELQEVVDQALQGYQSVRDKRWGNGSRLFKDAGYVVKTELQSYPGYVGWGILEQLGDRMRDLGLNGNAFVIADKTVSAMHGDMVVAAIEAAGLAVERYDVEAGEASKTLATAEAIYSWLASHQAERGHCVVSLGGGMIGDLAGFVAATYLRGMALVHVPTTLLSMVDASLGGKVAVDLPQGKNLVGAFHQPRMVLSDVRTLTTLPTRELTAGWAEVIKHGLILDSKFFTFLKRNRDQLLKLEPTLTAEAIRWSGAIKARVVSEDERETKGRRILLNYGHTVAHALEAATAYEGLLHGEAVAIGMTAAANISEATGLLSAKVVAEQRDTLQAYGLPVKLSEFDLDVVKRTMKLDKKVSAKAIRWVLLKGIGQSLTKADVPEKLIDAALNHVRSG
ncbi:3-dehydroquinate synthase [Dehalococcoidia bacterium]|nr:3-dehydroquinate synthase [Dehalococcoidia bacterium]